MKQLSFRSSRAAFTLLEIMLVVTIIAVLLASGIYVMRGNVEATEGIRAVGDIQGISTQLKTYRATNGTFPTTKQGLEALVTRPTTDPKPKRWYQLYDKIPTDPWREPYTYLEPGVHNTGTFDITSKGPDKQAGTEDDITNWETK